MTRIANSPISRPRAEASTDNRRSKAERDTALKTLDQAISGLSSRALSHRKMDWFEVETATAVNVPDKDHPNTGRTIPLFSLSKTESAKLGHDIEAIAVDLERGEFYFADRNNLDDVLAFGPIKLPSDGFICKNLLPNTFRDVAAKTPAEKILRKLTTIIRKQEPEVYGKPQQMQFNANGDRNWTTPDGAELQKMQTTIDGFKYGRANFMFDLSKKEFWIEKDSGTCEGPYKLPSKFNSNSIETLDSQFDVPADDAYDHAVSSGGSYSTVTGGVDSSTYLSVGGGGSGGSSVGGSGSSGSAFSYYISSRSGGGGGS